MTHPENYVIHLDYSERSHVLTGRPSDEMREKFKTQKVASYHPRLYVTGTTPVKGWLIKKDQLEKAKEIIEEFSEGKPEVKNLGVYSEFSVVESSSTTFIIERKGDKIGLSIEREENIILRWNGWKSYKNCIDWQTLDLAKATGETIKTFLSRVDWYEKHKWYPNPKRVKEASLQLLRNFLDNSSSLKISSETLAQNWEILRDLVRESTSIEKFDPITVTCLTLTDGIQWFCSRSDKISIGLEIFQSETDIEFTWNGSKDDSDEIFCIQFSNEKVDLPPLECFFRDVEDDILSLEKSRGKEILTATLEIICRFLEAGTKERNLDLTRYLTQPRKVFEFALKKLS